MNKKLLLTLAFSFISLLSACASAPKAESPAETAEIATIALNSSLDLSQEGRQPILPQEYDKPFVREILEKDSLVVGMLEEDRPPFFYHTGDGSMDFAGDRKYLWRGAGARPHGAVESGAL